MSERSAPATTSLQVLPVTGVPVACAGDDALQLLALGMRHSGIALQPGDLVAIAGKLLSRCEGRAVPLREVQVSVDARQLAAETGKDAALVELILRESERISRAGPNVLITRHRLGHVSANAAIDASNVPADGEVLLWPENPDFSAKKLSDRWSGEIGARVPVLITDSFGRPFRVGTVGVAIGCFGLEPVWDQRGGKDLRGRELQATWTATADAIASAADLVMGQGDEGIPAVVVRGFRYRPGDQGATALCRDPDSDLYL